MPKSRTAYRIDFDVPIKFGSVSTNATDDIALPANPTIGPPLNLALTTAIGYSSAAPTAVIDATWDKPFDATPSFYVIQVSTDNTFATVTIQQQAPLNSAHIEGLLPATLYYVRVQAFAGGISGAWSATASITTASDTAPAGVPTSPAAVWVGYGDLLITWVNPTNANFKDVKIVVRASSGGTIYRTQYSAAQSYLYTLATNKLDDPTHVGDSSLYVELQSRTFSNVLSSTVNTGLVTKAVPATPAGLAQSWSGDTLNNGTAGPDLVVNWTQADDAYYYRLTLDTVARNVFASRYTYTLDTNRGEHAGTPDPAVAYSLVAVDGFGQVSTAVSATATNQNPSTPTATLIQGAVSGLYAAVTTAAVADFAAYEYVFKRDGTTVATITTPASTVRYEMQGAGDDGYHSWTVVVRQKDVFGQFSLTATPSAVAFEALTLSGLRAQAAYSDSNSTSPATLKAALADGVTTSGGIVYAA